jgi:hypothetical protein
MPTFFVGVDIASERDYTAIAIIEPQLWVTAKILKTLQIDLTATESRWSSPTDWAPELEAQLRGLSELERPSQVPLFLVHIERVTQRINYPKIV